MRIPLLLAGALLAAGAAHAQAQVVQFTANLSGSNEAPTPVTTGSYGVATVTLDLSSQQVGWNIQVFNMPSGTQQAHFHVGGPGVAGPIVVNIAVPPQISNDYTLTGTASAGSLIRAAGGRDRLLGRLHAVADRRADISEHSQQR